MLWACHEMRMYILCTAAFCLNWLWHGNQFSEDQLYRKDMFPLRYIENAYKNTTTMPKVLSSVNENDTTLWAKKSTFFTA